MQPVLDVDLDELEWPSQCVICNGPLLPGKEVVCNACRRRFSYSLSMCPDDE